jgi:hypothetical protein
MNSKDEKSIEELMTSDYSYPSPSQENLQELLFRKRELAIHTTEQRKKITDAAEKKKYIDDNCAKGCSINSSQIILSNFINPHTPYKGILMFWGTGVGKTFGSIAVAEKFKPMVEKYGTKIHVLVPGPLGKANYINEILNCIGDEYYKYFDNPLNENKSIIVDEENLKKNATNIISQYYNIMTHRSFYKKVLGDKIKDKIISGNKVKTINRKDASGNIDRDVPINRIYSLDNTILIIDEAHRTVDNGCAEAIKQIISASKNLKILLLSATPMKNSADDIIELLNFLRPINNPIERDKVFTSAQFHKLEFKKGGKEYLRKMCRGYISYMRGSDPLTFAERVDMGEIPPQLNYTKVIRSYMLDFQLSSYNLVIEECNDSFDRISQAAANFVLPGLSKNKHDIVGFHGITGINEVSGQLRNNSEALCKKIASTVLSDFTIEDPSTLLYLDQDNVTITGDIFNEKYLRLFSIKFATCLDKINETYYGKRGIGLVFVYSNLVRAGIELFREVLRKNGYLEFQENYSSYTFEDETKCYFCGQSFSDHKSNIDNYPKHDFYPATFVSITGKSDEANEQIPEEKHKIIGEIFNKKENKEGKFIKIILGSSVMNEGTTLRNIKEVHVLDVRYNLGSVDQVIGRAIRLCTHYALTTLENIHPKVEIYKYVVSLEKGLSSEEEMYKKAELKYDVVKTTESILREEAIDCPLNRNLNIFQEEVEKFKDCGSKENPCPAVCSYTNCNYKCGDKLLNQKYYDPESNVYKKVELSDLDYSTYTNELAQEEISYAKEKIKELYFFDHIYILEDMINYVKNSYPDNKKTFFDNYYVFQALDDLLPVSENDFNIFSDIITDKYGKKGYLIYIDRFYIFQPFGGNYKMPIWYRKNYYETIVNNLTIKDYISSSDIYDKIKNKFKSIKENSVNIKYDFNSQQEYYDKRDEFNYVGIIDQKKKTQGKEIKNDRENIDEFKIRTSRPKFLEKKRETGIPSTKGSVCSTSKDKKFLYEVSEKIGLDIDEYQNRNDICNILYSKLFDLEKFSVSDKKMTYLIIPSNHPIIPFPLNLEDRVKSVISQLQEKSRLILDPKIKKISYKGTYPDIKYFRYVVTITSDISKISDFAMKKGFKKTDGQWICQFD